MTDIVDALRNGLCPPNTGCMSIKACICDLLGDAADEIERLRGLHKTQMAASHEHSRAMVKQHVRELDLYTAEIEELRAKDQHWNAHLRTAQDEIKRLTACLKWEQNWLARVGTHSPGCWQWGPGHYMCAVRHIEEMERGQEG